MYFDLQITCFAGTDVVPDDTPMPALRSMELAGSTLNYWPPDIVAPQLTRLAISSMHEPYRSTLSRLKPDMPWLPRLPALQVRAAAMLSCPQIWEPWHAALRCMKRLARRRDTEPRIAG